MVSAIRRRRVWGFFASSIQLTYSLMGIAQARERRRETGGVEGGGQIVRDDNGAFGVVALDGHGHVVARRLAELGTDVLQDP